MLYLVIPKSFTQRLGMESTWMHSRSRKNLFETWNSKIGIYVSYPLNTNTILLWMCVVSGLAHINHNANF